MKRSLPLLTAFCAIFTLTSCDKIWEIGQKLQAPEEPAPEEIVTIVEEEDVPLEEIVEVEAPPEPVETGPVIDEEIQVSILGYHDFADKDSSNAMVISTTRFRAQMEAIKKAEIPVITMKDFIAWKRGEKNIPNPSVVITIDDGWKSVYTHAYPILKEYGYPFSIYLYTNFLNNGGRSMSYDQVAEMMANGCEVGSHSVSHGDLSRNRKGSQEKYEEWLRDELGESMRILREQFGDEILPVFVYPYGKYNDKVVQLAEEYGYEVAVTVSPKKAEYSQEDLRVGRYIIHGNGANFNTALKFKGDAAVAQTSTLTSSLTNEAGEAQGPLVSLYPAEQSVIATRTPRVQVNVSKLGSVSSSGISMYVSGLGRVPVQYDSSSKIISYQIVEPLRSESCRVTVKFSHRGKTETLNWAFRVDRTALYLNEPAPVIKAQPIAAAPGAQ